VTAGFILKSRRSQTAATEALHRMSLKNSFLFPAIQSIHLIGIALLVGTIVLVDLRLLGFALTRNDAAEVRVRLAKWTRAGLAIMLATGPILFAADIPRYVSNPAFLLKMAILLVTLAFHVTLHRRPERYGKLVALISIALWTCVVLGGRAIADFDI
jgi:hypothetical protein